MTDLQDAHEIQQRLADHYLEVLRKANAYYQYGDAGMRYGFKLLEQDWEQIKLGQKWATLNAATDARAAALCIAYVQVGAELLELRQDSTERLSWLETALDIARRLN